GTALTSELRFTAEKGSETKRVEFKNLSASDLPDNVVCVESLTDSSGREIAAHDSLHDEGQTVRRPAISTTLVTKGSGRHVVVSDKNIELVDTVSYQGLVPGLPYTLEGTLVDAETGRRIHVAGAESSRGFTPREPSGKTQVTFKIDARKLEGKALVAFETLKNESSVVVATHEDAQDKNQTVRVPTIKTTLTDTSRKSHEVVADGRIRLVDTIEFKA
ncbi:VaFE repeat-containing surface-anchored protein, partial [Atopobiaceae bacterium SGI.236]